MNMSEISLLDSIKSPDQITKLSLSDLNKLSSELREEIVETISVTGGHLASSLGTVELTVAMYHVFNLLETIVVWDVGHQGYSHKLLTGRKDKFKNIGKKKGIAKFLERSESPFDYFGAGHASTSISAALGFQVAMDQANDGQLSKKVIAVIGDGAMSGGLAYEAVNLAGFSKKNLLVILNDNDRRIGKNVGLMTKAFNLIQKNELYNYIRNEVEDLTEKNKFPKSIHELLKRMDHSFMQFLSPQAWFEALGFRYFGPLDGHNIELIVENLKAIKNINGPILVHLKTVKGKGYMPAEQDSLKFHGVSGANTKKQLTYSQVFSEAAYNLVKKDSKAIVVCAAMVESYGLQKVAQDFPNQIIDVGIAEANAVCMAAGMAAAGLKPIVAIYSTFIQRAYDQLIHDVALQNLPVKFFLDRAGFVGPDGATHHGNFDLSYLRLIPNFVIMAPRNVAELAEMVNFCYDYKDGPIALRYPRANSEDCNDLAEIDFTKNEIKLGKGEILNQGAEVVIVTVGTMSEIAFKTKELLLQEKINPTIFDAKFIKPLDKESLLNFAKDYKLIVTIEENTIVGGFASALLELFSQENIKTNLLNFAIADRFISYGTITEQRAEVGLDPENIKNNILNRLKK